jgi:biopolymer transport protein ExbD
MAVKVQRGMSLGSLSLTPLIDVVFLLLIFFLVATRFEEEERDMDINLPRASEAQPTIAPQKELFVNVTKEGAFVVDGRELSLDNLQERLLDAYRTNPGQQRVIIRADRDSRTSNLVAVMNACNRANIRNYSVATE